MTTWARILNNIAEEIVTTNPAEIFHADVAAMFSVVPDGTLPCASFASGAWVNPPPVTPPPATPAALYAKLDPMAFYVAFKPTERMLIKALASTGIPANSPLLGGANAAIPADMIIAEFWETFELTQSSNTPIDTSLVSIQEGLAYLSAPTAPTPVVLAAGRAAQISLGIPQ